MREAEEPRGHAGQKRKTEKSATDARSAVPTRRPARRRKGWQPSWRQGEGGTTLHPDRAGDGPEDAAGRRSDHGFTEPLSCRATREKATGER